MRSEEVRAFSAVGRRLRASWGGDVDLGARVSEPAGDLSSVVMSTVKHRQSAARRLSITLRVALLG